MILSVVADANLFHYPWRDFQDEAFRHTVNVIDRWTGTLGTLYIFVPTLWCAFVFDHPSNCCRWFAWQCYWSMHDVVGSHALARLWNISEYLAFNLSIKALLGVDRQGEY